ncbi:MAG: RND transporter, partial [Candidatus Omnitrophota bacterium]
MIRKMMQYAIDRPKAIVWITVILVILALAQFPGIKVDTDPENMLPQDAPVRVFHREMKKEFGVHDFIVIGVVNNSNENGVFNVGTLSNIYNITEEIKALDGVIAREIIAPSTKD